MAIKNQWLRSLARRLGPPLYQLVSRGLFASCRVRTHGVEHLRACLRQQPLISACWHYGVYFHLYHVRRQQLEIDPQARWALMVSASGDAELLSGALRLMGATVVRGSRGRSGAAALKGMIEQVGKRANAGIIGDGSRGPARQAQPGAILLASRTGAPILPSAWAADRYVALRSWDRTVIPKPLARISYHYGPPLRVPAGVRGGELERFRQAFEERLNAVYREAWAIFGRAGH